jgi:Peptidase_C39 like family
MVSCPACRPSAPPVTRVRHENVPVYTQYATAGLIADIAYNGRDPGDDPAWATTGAQTQQEYATWCRHACGITCLRMALGHRDGTAPPLLKLLRASLSHGTYVHTDDGRIRGLFYAPLLEYARTAHGLDGQVHSHLDLDQIHQSLATGALVIVSVHKEIRRPDRPAPGAGGHLVLLTGYDTAADTLTLHNPSGHTPTSRAAELPVATFRTFFAHKGISLFTH